MMTIEQVIAFAEAMERFADELAGQAQALNLLARQVRERHEQQAAVDEERLVPRWPEGTCSE